MDECAPDGTCLLRLKGGAEVGLKRERENQVREQTKVRYCKKGITRV